MKSDVSFVLALLGRSSPLQAKLPKLAESFGVEEVVTFKKQWNWVLQELLLILGSQVKENLLKQIKTSPFSGIIKMRLAILQIST